MYSKSESEKLDYYQVMTQAWYVSLPWGYYKVSKDRMIYSVRMVHVVYFGKVPLHARIGIGNSIGLPTHFHTGVPTVSSGMMKN